MKVSKSIPVRGDSFGDLIYQSPSDKRSTNDRPLHHLKCGYCGKDHYRRVHRLSALCCTSPESRKLAPKVDVLGSTYDQWVVTERVGVDKHGLISYKCVASCCGDIQIRSSKQITKHKSPCKCQKQAQTASMKARYKNYNYEHAKHLKATFYRYYVQWRVDYDYTHKLNEDEKAWLARFTLEYYGGMFDQNPHKVINKQPKHIQSIKDTIVQDRRDIYSQGTRAVLTWDIDYSEDQLDVLISSHLAYIRTKINSKALQKAA